MLNPLKTELAQFRRLSQNGRDLLVSYVLYGTGYAALGVFVGAYLWSKTSDIGTVSIYYFAHFITITFFFYLNGLLSKRVKVNYLFSLGLIVLGLAPLLLVLVVELTLPIIALIGMLEGIGAGFYWANRNYLTVDAVPDSQRNYFFGMNIAADTFSAVVVPLAVGFLIASAGNGFLGNTDNAYKFVMGLVFAVFSYSAFILRDNTFHAPQIKGLFMRGLHRSWLKVRALTFFYSFTEGLMFYLPVLLVLILIGAEGELGAIESVTSLSAAALVYVLARRTNNSHRPRMILLSAVIFSLGALTFGLFYSSIAALIFIIGQRLSRPIANTYVSALWYEAIEKDQHNESENYKYILDIEIFINIGRVSGIAGFLLLLHFLPQEVALRTALVSLILIQFGMYFSASRLARGLTNSPK